MEHVLESKGVAAGNITRELLREEIHNLLAEVGLQRNLPIRDAVATTAPKRSYFTWGGKFHLIPREFNFPSIDPLGAWLLWWFGNSNLGYPPYRKIPYGDLDTPQKKATLSE
ncbi:hypothetical protein L914_05490 [Phytophthora nicotianae]|uniref:Uncharacterized protein n=2 Tax=Phytophthora nicotianae TaxID=4792 RepID=W2NPB2_PHYNI|nr:hypothetical protein L914_05490 [Phytophthora nicotianae]